MDFLTKHSLYYNLWLAKSNMVNSSVWPLSDMICLDKTNAQGQGSLLLDVLSILIFAKMNQIYQMRFNEANDLIQQLLE